MKWIENIENVEDLYNSKVLSVDYKFIKFGAFLKLRTEHGYVDIEFRGPFDYEVELEFAGFDI